jgi:hypothetical protein
MLESKDHQQDNDSGGALDLTFAFRGSGQQDSERQIRSTSATQLPADGQYYPAAQAAKGGFLVDR